MSDMFICPTCKRPTQQADNEIIEHLAKEIDRYIEVLIERTKELDRKNKALDVAVDALKHYCTDSDNWSCVIDFTGDYDNTPSEFADKALEQITALEQKDK